MDPHFREQFGISRHDDEFDSFLDHLPNIFVGTPAMLDASIRTCVGEFSCQAMRRVARQQEGWWGVRVAWVGRGCSKSRGGCWVLGGVGLWEGRRKQCP